MIVRFHGVTGCPQLQVVHTSQWNNPTALKEIAKSWATKLGDQYYWCGIFESETGPLLDEFTFRKTLAFS